MTFSGIAMTIPYHITIGGHFPEETIKEVINDTFSEVNQIYNKYNPSSELSRLNALKANEKMELSLEMTRFLQLVDRVVQATEGRFDPTIEPLQAIWKMRMEEGTLPDSLEIENLLPAIGWHHIHFQDGVFYKDHSSTSMDFGGIAKGYCVDLLAERLKKLGIHHFLVEWGGEISSFGKHPSRRSWYVGIPSPNQVGVAMRIPLRNQSLATSGDYFQTWTVQDKVYTHILHPKTLAPLEPKKGSIASSSVIADTCTMADALATTAMLFETPTLAEEWIEQMKKERLASAIWVMERL